MSRRWLFLSKGNSFGLADYYEVDRDDLVFYISGYFFYLNVHAVSACNWCVWMATCLNGYIIYYLAVDRMDAATIILCTTYLLSRDKIKRAKMTSLSVVTFPRPDSGVESYQILNE